MKILWMNVLVVNGKYETSFHVLLPIKSKVKKTKQSQPFHPPAGPPHVRMSVFICRETSNVFFFFLEGLIFIVIMLNAADDDHDEDDVCCFFDFSSASFFAYFFFSSAPHLSVWSSTNI